ncbi:MAG TPA: radical SAM protein [Candidatus Mediterraneibacter merdipullorum]|nr:radical SAM protein [Candidatus Mediterraneibacter merdipullorum]
MEKKGFGLYVHIPFCVKKCAYCDFLSGPADAGTRSRYADALIREIQTAGNRYGDYCADTIFLGGGTPSLLEADETARIFHALYEAFSVSPDAEITMEANPGTVTREKAEAWKACGVNRLSIGLQSVDDRELKLLGRIHTYRDFLDTWDTVRRAGFDNVNIDLISALPGQTRGQWEKTLRAAASLSPEHISAYSLIIEEGTPFFTWYGGAGLDGAQDGADACAGTPPFSDGSGDCQDLPPLPDEDTERDIYQATERILSGYGYHRYEISNYAKEGYECRHNLGYWERKEYLGLGLGAASLIRECRFHNTADMDRYLEVFGRPADRERHPAGEGGPAERPVPGEAAEEIEALREEDRMEEFMFLGLRRMKGVGEKEFSAAFGRDIRQVYGRQLEKLTRQGLLACAGGRFFLTGRGIDISNYVFSEFLF